MTNSTAREAIIRKFTNYRKNKADNDSAEANAMRYAADLIANFQSYSKGQSLFKKRKHNEIRARRNELCLADPGLAQIAAYSKAVKQLWAEEVDHAHWESQAREIGDEVFR